MGKLLESPLTRKRNRKVKRKKGKIIGSCKYILENSITFGLLKNKYFNSLGSGDVAQ
jgi:hypothetical protein